MEPCKMGRYKSYFTNSPHVLLGEKYSVGLRGFDCWAKQIMTLSRFKRSSCAMHPEGAQLLNNGDKCYQLRHFIHTFKRKAKKIFHLGLNASFDEGGVPIHSRFCPVRQFNKYKPDKFRVDFFILVDAEHYFIHHLGCYQGKNKANIDIDPTISTFSWEKMKNRPKKRAIPAKKIGSKALPDVDLILFGLIGLNIGAVW
eukprot:15362134-Ditylum_brightwellii.AAC.1